MVLPILADITLVAHCVSAGLVGRRYACSFPGAILKIPSVEARVSHTLSVRRSWFNGSVVSAVSNPVLVNMTVGPDQTVGADLSLQMECK
jgi:hypothetical protein